MSRAHVLLLLAACWTPQAVASRLAFDANHKIGVKQPVPDIDATKVPFADVAGLFNDLPVPQLSLFSVTPKVQDATKKTEQPPPSSRRVVFLENAATFDESSREFRKRTHRRAHAASLSKMNATREGIAAAESANVVPLGATSWYHLLRLTFSFTLIVKCLCIMSNVVMQASPFPQVRRIIDKKSTGECDSAPFIGIFFCACQSSFYGFFAFLVTQKSGFLVLLYSNVVGVTFGAYYVLSYMKNCDTQRALEVTYKYLKFAVTIWGMESIVIATNSRIRALFFVGFTSSCCSLISSGSLLTTVPEVLRTRCSQTLPVPVLYSCAVSSLLWFVCGLTLWDPYITLPNLMGLFACLFALGLARWYPADPIATNCDKREGRISNSDEDLAEKWGDGCTGGT